MHDTVAIGKYISCVNDTLKFDYVKFPDRNEDVWYGGRDLRGNTLGMRLAYYNL